MAQKAQVNPVLAYYLASLTSKPLLTKSLTGLVVSYASEITAARLSGTAPVVHKNTGLPPIDFVLSNDKALKLAAYGALISAPMGHTLLSLLQRAFVGLETPRYKLLQIIVANLIISPIQIGVYLSSMAIINGCTSVSSVRRILAASFFGALKLNWIISPISMAIAQKYLAPDLWVVFFTCISGIVGCGLNVAAKKAALLKAKKDNDSK